MTNPSIAKPSRNSLSKSEILRGYRAYGRVLSRGSYVQKSNVRCYFDMQREIPPYTCTVGFAVRKAPSSVVRNRARRLMRESYRQRKHELVQWCQEQSVQLEVVLLMDLRFRREVRSYEEVDGAVAILLASMLKKLRER